MPEKQAERGTDMCRTNQTSDEPFVPFFDKELRLTAAQCEAVNKGAKMPELGDKTVPEVPKAPETTVAQALEFLGPPNPNEPGIESAD